MINPYASVNWNTVNKIVSCSHEHCENQAQFNKLVASSGIRHIAISNYYPSAPVYPLSEMFTDIPSNAISCPNAEHHNVTLNGRSVGALHINGLGSTFESGKPRGETPTGCGGANVLQIIDFILDDLLFQDGGGVTINHPTWTGLSFDNTCEILDHDSRVLGIEFFNATSEDDGGRGWAIDLWDEILATGRKCYGFAVADHEGQGKTDWRGRNVLLVPETTEHECLKAYRNGAFYGQIRNTDLSFVSISCDGNTLSAVANNADTIKVIIDGNETEYSGNTVTATIPSSAVYARVEAHTSEDSIYSNPFIFKEFVPKPKSNMTRNILLYM